MKKLNILFVAFTLFLSTACDKESLDLINPNEPGMTALETEQGLIRASLGIYEKFGLEYWWLALNNHDLMGDAYASHVGNFAWRWLNQPTSMTLSDGTVITPPAGGSQPDEMRNRNSRAFSNDNQFYNEWLAVYLVNNQANMLLEILESENLSLSGNAEEKKKIVEAWAYWWKGFAYSRIGSLYIAGIITDVFNETNDNYVTNTEMIAAANANFDKAISVLQTLSATETYIEFLGGMIPSFTKVGNGGALTPEEWIRNINTYKARNLLVNKSVNDLSAGDLAAIKSLAENGIRQGDKIFTMRSASENDLVSLTAWQPYRSLAGWSYISERLIQEFYPGDDRFTRNFYIPANGYWQLNPGSRGFQYSTRFNIIPIESGGDYSTTVTGLAEIPVGGSFEENELMLAEAKIRAGDIEGGVAHIDAVREFQRAGLAPLTGQGLSQEEALEHLRRERRVGLLNKGVAFYDARRVGYLKPVSQGGGRHGAVLLYPNANNEAALDTNVTINYNYLEWWDVPMNELEFNAPRQGSAPVEYTN